MILMIIMQLCTQKCSHIIGWHHPSEKIYDTRGFIVDTIVGVKQNLFCDREGIIKDNDGRLVCVRCAKALTAEGKMPKDIMDVIEVLDT